MCWRHGAIRQNRKSLIDVVNIKLFHICIQNNVIGDILSDIIVVFLFLRSGKMGNGCREPVGGRRELVSHHGATGGGGPGAENAAFSTV
jgi:hypothetical protein